MILNQIETDFREPENRREAFLKFYEFHLKYRSHPGGVYFLLPYLSDMCWMTEPEKFWMAYINGNTQHPVTSWLIFNRYRSPSVFLENGGEKWFNENWHRLGWDMDRRYQKKEFPGNVAWYYDSFKDNQLPFLEGRSFQDLWSTVRSSYPSFGRLSAFSYLEYTRIQGLDQDCDDLFLEDMSGSKSHRNGLAIVLGRDDLDWHGDAKPTYTRDILDWFKYEASELLKEARQRTEHPDVSYYTLESALCTYKSWHRPNRRYPNVYMDMLHDRIKWMESRWPEEDFSIFWNARRENLPKYLRLEDNPLDPGVSKEKQNFYLNTGKPVMMSRDFPEFANDFDRRIWSSK